MRIILANKFYWRKAGAEAYMLDLEVALKRAGHEVAVFATDHPETIDTPWRKYFPRYRDFSRSEGAIGDAAKFATMVWSREAARKMRKLIADFKPDVVHAQNVYHHLSPSVIAAADRAGVPVVQTLHDYKFICPNYKLFTDGAACERCHVYRYWNAVLHECVKGSRPASAAAAVEMWIHRALKAYERGVSRFVTPSAAMREIFLRWGKDPERIVHVPNLVDLSRLPPRQPGAGNGFLYVGQLIDWKGVWTLIEAAAEAPDLRFRVVGSGPLDRALRDRVRELGLTNVSFVGFLERERVYAEMAAARAVIVPSIGYDPYPTVALEAGAVGRPVIGSDIGGIPEIVLDRETGRLFTPGDAESLVARLRELELDHVSAERMGGAAAMRVRALVDPDRHLAALVNVYSEAIAERGSRR